MCGWWSFLSWLGSLTVSGYLVCGLDGTFDTRVHLQGANKVTLSGLFDPISFGAVDAPRFVGVYEMARVLGKDRDLLITTGWNSDALSVPI